MMKATGTATIINAQQRMGWWLCCLLISSLGGGSWQKNVADAASDIGDGLPDDVTPATEWYKRYPVYPEYCSTPAQMATRTVPPLKTFSQTNDGEAVPETRLRHVTAVIRHGARTIASRDSPCWDGYWDNPETAIWHCPLSEKLAPPTPLEILQDEGDNMVFAPDAMFLFQKNFDVTPNRNVLEGTCQLGQLMAQGYEQLVFTGNMIRDTYLYEQGDMNHDERMRLFNVPEKKPGVTGLDFAPWEEPNFYLRAEDSQPTMVSGQLIMQGLFGPELDMAHQSFFQKQDFATVPVHTGDASRDVVTGYTAECPRLDYLKQVAESSPEFQAFYNSEKSKQVRDFMKEHLSYDTQLFDCLMTSVCTDRPLPNQFGIYSPHPDSWFNRVTAYHATNHSFHYQHNNAEYSKLSMGPLWAEILDHILPVLNEKTDEAQNDRTRPPSKMAVYSGHSETLIQLLSTLGVWESAHWPPYASTVLIEIHEMVDDDYLDHHGSYSSGYAFRLIYNGDVLTGDVDGCNDDLCDAQVLMDHLTPIATRGISCTVADDEISQGAMTVVKEILSDTVGIILLLVVITCSALVGSVGAFFYLTGTLPNKDEVLPKGMTIGNNAATSEDGRASAGIEPFEISMADADESDYSYD